MTHELTNLELESFEPRTALFVRLTSPHSGRSYVLPCEVLSEDRIVGSGGTHPLDRFQIDVAGEFAWVERRDLCGDGGELIAWVPYEESGS